MSGQRTVAAGDLPFGAVGEGVVSTFVIQIFAMAGAAIQPQGRVIGSAGAYSNLSAKKRSDDSAVATIAAVGIYEINVAGLELQISFDAATTFASAMVVG